MAARIVAARSAVVFAADAEWAEHIDTNALLLRGHANADDADNAAIQDDAPAARLDIDESIAPPLEPLGTLASQRDSLPSHRVFSRRSPRGPPVFQ